MPAYPDEALLRDARATYFADNGFGDGGYDARWVKVMLGPVPFFIPNTKGRVRAVRLHDVHHVLTGYDTDLVGEGEIGAFELASGCGDHWAAWFLNLSATALGCLLDPGAVFRAFVRGRRSRNLYPGEWDEGLLAEPVGALRARLAIAPRDAEPRAGDRAAFAAWAAAGFGVLLLQALPVLLLVAWLLSRLLS